jgi:NADH-quinone oxidoreductase subunit L
MAKSASATAHDDHGHGAHHDAHDDHGHHGPVEPHESPKVVTVPLILLAIPAIASGWLIGTILYGNWFGGAITIAETHKGMATMAHEFHGIFGMMTARRHHAAVLAGDLRRRDGLVPLHRCVPTCRR